MALVNMRIEEIDQYCPLRKNWPPSNAGWTVIVTLMTTVAGGIFVDLIRDLIRKYDDKALHVNGHHVPPGEASSAFVARVIDGLIIDNHLQKNKEKSEEDIDS